MDKLNALIKLVRKLDPKGTSNLSKDLANGKLSENEILTVHKQLLKASKIRGDKKKKQLEVKQVLNRLHQKPNNKANKEPEAPIINIKALKIKEKDIIKLLNEINDSRELEEKIVKFAESYAQRYGTVGTQIALAQLGERSPKERFFNALKTVVENTEGMEFEEVYEFYLKSADTFFPYLGYKNPSSFHVPDVEGYDKEKKALLIALEASAGNLALFLKSLKENEIKLSNKFLESLYLNLPTLKETKKQKFTVAELMNDKSKVYEYTSFITEMFNKAFTLHAKKVRLQNELKDSFIEKFQELKSVKETLNDGSIINKYNEYEANNDQLYKKIDLTKKLINKASSELNLAPKIFLKQAHQDLLSDIEKHIFEGFHHMDSYKKFIPSIDSIVASNFSITSSTIKYESGTEKKISNEIKKSFQDLSETEYDEMNELVYDLIREDLAHEDCEFNKNDTDIQRKQKEAQIKASWQALTSFLKLQNKDLQRSNIEIPVNKIQNILKEEYKINPNSFSELGLKWIDILCYLLRNNYFINNIEKDRSILQRLKDYQQEIIVENHEEPSLDILGFYNAFRGRIVAESMLSSGELSNLYNPMHNGFLDSKGFDLILGFKLNIDGKDKEFLLPIDSKSNIADKDLAEAKFINANVILCNDSFTNIAYKLRRLIQEKTQKVKDLLESNSEISDLELLAKTDLITEDLFNSKFNELLNSKRHEPQNYPINHLLNSLFRRNSHLKN